MNRAISHFETCVSNMHRAIKCFQRIRGDREREPLTHHLRTGKVTFASAAIADKFRIIRNEIHHLEEEVMERRITDGQRFVLSVDGHKLLIQLSQTGLFIRWIDLS